MEGLLPNPLPLAEVYTHCPTNHAELLPYEFGERWRYEAFKLRIGEGKEITAFGL